MLTVRANAKINWALAVTGRRSDGYHELDMLTQSVSLHDTLTFEAADELSLSIDGGPAGWSEDNLVCRAASLLKRTSGITGGAHITLVKRIPAMAGLGGGSADGAAALRALNRLWNLRLPAEELRRLGLSLGADFPFCLTGGLQRVRGIGERLAALPAPPSPGLVLIMPDGGLSTGAVFGCLDQHSTNRRADHGAASDALCAGDYARLDKLAFNDLTASAQALSPAVSLALEDLRAAGSPFVRMSGSGSCCFGVFDDPIAACERLRPRWPAIWLADTCSDGVEFE